VPYTKPDRTTRTRASVTQSTPAPALSIVKFLIEPQPVVDAAKYRAWAPDLDTPTRKKGACAPAAAGRPSSARLESEVLAQVVRRINAGEQLKFISANTGVELHTLRRISQRMRVSTPVTVPAPVVVVPVVDVDIERAAPASAPVCLPASPEPMRTHILDWKTRFDAFEFSIPPAGCLPRKGRKRISSMTRGQLGETLRSHGELVPLAINCAAPGHHPRASTERPEKSFKTAQKSKFFVGGEAVDVESSWRTLCTT